MWYSLIRVMCLRFCSEKSIQGLTEVHKRFLATLVALHFTPVSESLAGQSFGWRPSSVAWSLRACFIFKSKAFHKIYKISFHKTNVCEDQAADEVKTIIKIIVGVLVLQLLFYCCFEEKSTYFCGLIQTLFVTKISCVRSHQASVTHWPEGKNWLK